MRVSYKNISVLLITLFTFTNTQFIKSQRPSREFFNFILENNLEDNVVGNYQVADFYEDWIQPRGNSRLSEMDIMSEDNANYKKYMRGYFPKGTIGPNGGWSWNVPLSGTLNEVYFSYDIRFKPGFMWVLGGKIPGVTGGSVLSGVLPSYDDGFSARMMWKEDGRLVFYVYHHDQQIIYGSTYYWGSFKFTSGQWYNLTIRLVLNTVKDKVGMNDGILEGFVDGKLLFQKTDFRFRNYESIKIDNLYICSFFGGNDAAWNSARDEYIDTDNFVVYTYKNAVTEVPRGLETSQSSKPLIHPYRNIPDTEWKKSLKTNSITTTAINLTWIEYPVPTSYILERKEEGSTVFNALATIPYGTVTYSDKNVKAGLGYKYRLKAVNSVSNELSVVAKEAVLPNAPTLLTVADRTKSSVNLKWTDNSKNEEEFLIYRSNSASSGFTKIGSVDASIVTFEDNTLQPATTYYYRVRGYNQDGYSAYSNVLSATTLALQIPASPADLTVSQVSYTSVLLNWTDKSGNETNFILERSGPNDFTKKKVFSLLGNSISYSDTGLIMNSSYQYRVMAENDDGNSVYTPVVECKTLYIAPPAAPSKLKSTEFTDASISVVWDDNSTNEDGFIITRSLVTDPASKVAIEVGANDTAYTDSNLVASTTYLYTVKAINKAGNSKLSNKNVATTLSHAESKRVKEYLIAYYNFGYNPDNIIYDQSGFGDPVNLKALNPAAIAWNDDNTMDILSNTALVSVSPASKISRALKKTNELTLECWIKPMEPDFTAESRIVSLGNNDEEIGFVLDQGLSGNPETKSLSYSVRMQTQSTNPSGYPEFEPDLVQPYINLQHLAYVKDSLGNEILYLNGVKSSEGFRPSGFDTWNDGFYLRLGNESDMNHSWKGSYYLVAIYDKALSLSEVTTNYTAGPCDNLKRVDLTYQVEISPNPISDHATITVKPNEDTDFAPHTTINIIDVYGNIIHQESVFNPNDQFTRTMDFRSFPQGMYFLQVVSGKSHKTTKLVVQR